MSEECLLSTETCFCKLLPRRDRRLARHEPERLEPCGVHTLAHLLPAPHPSSRLAPQNVWPKRLFHVWTFIFYLISSKSLTARRQRFWVETDLNTDARSKITTILVLKSICPKLFLESWTQNGLQNALLAETVVIKAQRTRQGGNWRRSPGVLCAGYRHPLVVVWGSIVRDRVDKKKRKKS